jgi:hypothetical protein
MEVPFEVGQGPEGAAVPYVDRRMYLNDIWFHRDEQVCELGVGIWSREKKY